MGTAYASRQSTYTQGDTINADDTNDEFDAIISAFGTSGHSHDGTSGEGGAIAKLLSNTLTFGAATSGTDITITFDGESNDGVLAWMEDEDYFKFSDDILINSTEKIMFGDTASFIHQSSDGVLTIDGEATIDLNASTAVLVSNDLKLNSDAAVLGFGADNDVTLTHVADTGLLLNSTMAIQFNDASQYINAPSATVLDINATDEVEVNATLMDVNANLEVSGDVTFTGASYNAVWDNSDNALEFADNAKAKFGNSGDLEIYAASGASYVKDVGSGSFNIMGTNLFLLDAAGEYKVGAVSGGAVTLYHDNSAAKLATKSDGVDVTGELQADSLDIDGNSQLDGTLTVGVDDTGYDVKFFGDTASAYMLWDTSTDDLILGGASTLGVGTTAPDGKVHIHSASAGSVTANANADELIIENSGFAGLSILTANDQLASIVFGDPDDNDVAGINYDHSGNSMRFVVNADEHVRIDSNGNMIIGGTTAVTGAALTVEGPDSAAGSLNYVAAIRNSDAYSTTPASGIIFQNKYNSGGSYADAGGIEVVKENATDGEYGFGLGLHTRANGSAITEKLHITGEGLVMINGSASSYDTTPPQAGLSLYYETDTGAATIGTYSGGGNTRLAFSTNTSSGANAERLRIEGAGSVWTPTVSGASNNLRLGYLAGEDIASGTHYNTLIGDSAGKEINAGDGNTAVGYQAGDALTSGGYNTAIGHNAMSANQTGASAVAVGNQALATATIGNIVAVGDGAGQYHQTGVNFTALGFRALQNSTTGASNTAVGSYTMDATTTGGYNTAVGANALGANSLGSLNVAVGNDCLFLSTESSSNTAVGSAASRSNTTGTQNIAIGQSALYANQTGNYNTVVGAYALDAANPSSTTTTMMNVAIGAYSGSALTTGYDNTFVGAESAQAGTITGFYNTVVGKTAAYYLSTGNNNTVMGKLAGYTNATGSSNTYIGSSCAFTAEAGGNNVAIGQSAAYYMTTGHNNVVIGNSAGVGTSSQYITTAGHSVIIGDTAYAGSQTGDYQIVIGSNIVGKGANTGFISANGSSGSIYQGNDNASWATTSDSRLKKNISDNNVGLDAIDKIRVRNYEYRKPEEITELDPSLAIEKEGVQLGVVAQEIQKVLPNVVKEEAGGWLSVSNDDVTWHLVNAVKELSAKVKELEEKLNG